VFIPYRVDVPYDHRPVMNWLVFGAVIVVYALQVADLTDYLERGLPVAEYAQRGVMSQFVLRGWGLKGLFGHMWLHGGLIHLVGNLIFLWLFGNAVCSKIGNVLYVPVYVGLGLAGGVSHLLFGEGAVVGASGAINGLVGMYLVYFPENSISCFFWLLWYPVRFSVSGLWVILLWFAFDVYGVIRGGGGVAYLAHVGGFVTGFVLAIVLLRMRVVEMERDEKSLLELLGLDEKGREGAGRRDLFQRQSRWRRQATDQEDREVEGDGMREEEGAYIRFVCPCGQRVKVGREYAGRVGRCPRCSRRLRVPGG